MWPLPCLLVTLTLLGSALCQWSGDNSVYDKQPKTYDSSPYSYDKPKRYSGYEDRVYGYKKDSPSYTVGTR